MKNRLQLLKLKMRALLDKLPSLPKLPTLSVDAPLRRVAGAVLLFLISSFLVLNAPKYHSKFLRAYVGTHVYKIMANPSRGGGGTGFSLKAPSGQSYIVTNSHVCEAVMEMGVQMHLEPSTVLVIDDEGFAMKRRVLEISNKSDICLIEGLPGESGLHMGSEADVGDLITTLGHPLLEPLTSSSGEVIAKLDISILDYIMKSGDEKLDKLLEAKDGKCDQPKNEIKEQIAMTITPDGITLIKIESCMVTTKNAYQTNMIVYPGNSGSPVVDAMGRVIGIVFAENQETHKGLIVNLKDLKDFIARY